MKDSIAQFKKLHAALQSEKAQLESRLNEINVALGAVSVTGLAAPVAVVKGKRNMSPEGRARIIAAQKKRWAKVKASKSKQSTPAKPKAAKKSKMSAEGRARISAAMKARWAKEKASEGKEKK
jgi:hypothetical protein